MLGVCVDTNVRFERGVYRRRASCGGRHGLRLSLRLLVSQRSGSEAAGPDVGVQVRLKREEVGQRSWNLETKNGQERRGHWTYIPSAL